MNQELMMLVVHLRLMNLAYHNFHNMISGNAFFSDHEALDKFYHNLNDEYDLVTEKCIGLGFEEVAHLKTQIQLVEAHIHVLPDIIDWNVMHSLEIHLADICTKISQGFPGTSGLKHMLEEIADRSEVRQYKIKQRLKG